MQRQNQIADFSEKLLNSTKDFHLRLSSALNVKVCDSTIVKKNNQLNTLWLVMLLLTKRKSHKGNW